MQVWETSQFPLCKSRWITFSEGYRQPCFSQRGNYTELIRLSVLVVIAEKWKKQQVRPQDMGKRHRRSSQAGNAGDKLHEDENMGRETRRKRRIQQQWRLRGRESTRWWWMWHKFIFPQKIICLPVDICLSLVITFRSNCVAFVKWTKCMFPKLHLFYEIYYTHF